MFHNDYFMLTSIQCDFSKSAQIYALDYIQRAEYVPQTDKIRWSQDVCYFFNSGWWQGSHGIDAPTHTLVSELVGDDDDARTEFISPLSVLFRVFSSFALHNLQFLDSSLLDIAAALTHLAVAASHDNRLERSSERCGGSLFNAYRRVETNSRRLR